MATSTPTDAPGATRAAVGGTHRVLFAVVAIGWVVADQLTKWWATTLDGRTVDVVWTLRFQSTENHGASFSLGTGMGAWIGLLALLVVGVLVWQGRSVRSRLGAVALGMIVGGALGNVIDRAVREGNGFLGGGVVDFIDLQWWPVFNVADIGVVCGAILLVISMLRAPVDVTADAVTADDASVDGED